MHDIAERLAADPAAIVQGRCGPSAGFRDYVEGRKYDFGRGSTAAWSFIAHARGDRGLPDAKSWSELEAYLRKSGSPDDRVAAARSVWRSFTAHRSRVRRRDRWQ